MTASANLSPAPAKKRNRYIHLWILIAITLVLMVIAALLGSRLKAPGFLGTPATLGAGLAVLFEIAGLIALWIGRSLARRKDFFHHQRVQTSVMLFNLVVIVFVMVVTFSQQVIGPGAAPNDPVVLLEIGHGLSGVLLELLGLYIVVRMWFEKVLPQWFLFKNFRLLMLTTLFWWTLQTAGGVAIFGLRYLAAPIGSASPIGPAGPPSGSATMRDDKVHSDSILITFQNAPQPPSGQRYAGWLIGNNGQYRLSLGALNVDGSGSLSSQYTTPDGTNLLRLYNEFLISIEPAGSILTQPSDQIAFSAVVPDQSRALLEQLLVDAPDRSYQLGYLVDLLDSARRLSKHVDVARESLDNGDLTAVHRQAELMVNLLEGDQGAHYGDVDGDGHILNDGSGAGLMDPALDKIKQTAQAAGNAPDATPSIKLHTGHVVICIENARTWAQQLDDKALALARTNDLAAAKSILADLAQLAKNLLVGVDQNNDGRIDPVVGEGTIEVAYKHGQFAASPVYQAPLTAGGNPPSVPEEPAPPAPTQPAVPALGPNEVAVTLENFSFNQPAITVKVGTKVIWINRDPVPHTVTFDDKAFDSGTLAQGQTASFTFDKPGEFAYYCLFHGGEGGVGMSGKVTVTP